MKSNFECLFATLAAVFLIFGFSGCAIDQLAESVQGSGTFVAEDGTTTTFEIDTRLSLDVDSNGDPCTDLMQYGTAVFSDCEADIQATIEIAPMDVDELAVCTEMLQRPEVQNTPEFENFLDCFLRPEENGFPPDSFVLGFISGQYELRSCEPVRTTTVYRYYHFHSSNQIYFCKIGECPYYEGDSKYVHCGYGYKPGKGRYSFGYYYDVEESNEVIGTGCLYALVADGIERTNSAGTDTTEPDVMAVFLLDEDGNPVYSNCGTIGSGGFNVTPLDAVENADLRLCPVVTVFNEEGLEGQFILPAVQSEDPEPVEEETETFVLEDDFSVEEDSFEESAAEGDSVVDPAFEDDILSEATGGN